MSLREFNNQELDSVVIAMEYETISNTLAEIDIFDGDSNLILSNLE